MSTSSRGNGEQRNTVLKLYNPAEYTPSSPEDKKLFFTVQMSLYLHYKQKGIKSAAERDMLEDLLSVYWEEIEKSGILDGKSFQEKRCICSEFRALFPYTVVPPYLRQK